MRFYSPYTDPPFTLFVGPNSKQYYIPRHLLQQQNSRQIASLFGPSPYVHVPNIDESTGHVLAHYLYTGTYQTLGSLDTSPAKAPIEFKKAVAAYKTAKSLGIEGLQKLAMEHIEQSGKETTIFSVIEAINDNFSQLAGDTNRFQEYLIGRFNKAFQEDWTIFVTNDFFEKISNADLCKFTAKHVVELYSNKISTLLNLDRREPIAVEEEPVIVEREPVAVQEDSVDSEVTVGEGCISAGPSAVANIYGGKGDEEKKEEDDWGTWDTGTKKKRGKRSKPGEEESDNSKEKEGEAERKKEDEEAAAAAAAATTIGNLEQEPDPEPASVSSAKDPSGSLFTTFGAYGRKNKNIMNEESRVEEVKELLPTPLEPKGIPELDLMKKAKAGPEPQPEPEPVLGLFDFVNDCRSTTAPIIKKKENKKGRDGPVMMPAPEPEPELIVRPSTESLFKQKKDVDGAIRMRTVDEYSMVSSPKLTSARAKKIKQQQKKLERVEKEAQANSERDAFSWEPSKSKKSIKKRKIEQDRKAGTSREFD